MREPWPIRLSDWFVRVWSPARAARRAHARRVEKNPGYADLWNAVQRSYKAAQVGTTTTPWAATAARDADAEILHDLPALRARARELSRNDPIGSGLLDEFTRGVVGSGLVPQARTDDLEKNRKIEEVYRDLSEDLAPADGLTYSALQRMRFRKWIEDGDILIKRSIFSGADRMQTETIEADRLGSPFAPQGAPGIPTMLGGGGSNTILAGVERDDQSRIVAYHVNRIHPGSYLLYRAKQFEFVRVPVEEAYLLKLTDRPGQTRGVPLLHAVLQDLRDLDLLIEASLKRTQVAACLAAFIESSATTEGAFPVTAQNEGGYLLDQDIRPSMLMKLYPGEKVTTLVPNFPTPELVPFIVSIAQRIGAALGVSWATILHDWHDFTYSGARTQILADRPTWAILRGEFASMLEWERFHVLQDALLRGDQRLAGVTEDDLRMVEFTADPEPWVDPLKEAQAVQVQLEAGLTCLRDEVSRRGKDWEELIRQRKLELLTAEKVEKELREEMELPEVAMGEEVDAGVGEEGEVPELTVLPGGEAQGEEVPGVEAIEDTALNGAQVTALVQIVKDVTDDLLPAATAIALILAAFPGITPETAQKIIAPAEAFEPAQPEPAPVLGSEPGPPPEKIEEEEEDATADAA